MGLFDDVMKDLDPDVILRKTQLEHDEARGKYVVKSPIVRSHDEFVREVIAYANFHHTAIFGLPMPDDYALDKAREFLENGVKGGWKTAVLLGLSGNEGGMRYICNAICDSWKYRSERAYFDYIMDVIHIDPLNFEQVVQLMKEFKTKLSDYAPPSFKLLSPEAMAADYKNIIWEYITSLKKYYHLKKYY